MTIIEQILPEFMLKFFQFLAIPLCPYIQIWTIVHFFIAGLIFYLIRKQEKPLLLLLELLIMFEGLEFLLSFGGEFILGTPIILKEEIADTLIDIIIGMLGAFLMYIILKIKK